MHICEIPHVIFKSTSYFSFKFSITLLCHERKLLCTFVAQTIYTLVTRRRALDFQVFGSKFVKFLMSILKRQVSFSSIFASFFTVMPHNFSVNFKPIHSLLWTKGPHQSSNFDAFEYTSFSKQQVSFSSNFTSLLNVMKDNSCVLF